MLIKIGFSCLLFFISLNVFASQFKQCGVNPAKGKVVVTQCYCNQAQCNSSKLGVYQHPYKTKFKFYCEGKIPTEVKISTNDSTICSKPAKGKIAMVVCTNKTNLLQSIAVTLGCK